MADHAHADCPFCSARRKAQRCQLCGGALSPRWDPADPLLCRACGAGNRRLHAIEDRGAEVAHDNHVEEQVALGRDIWAGEWDDTDA